MTTRTDRRRLVRRRLMCLMVLVMAHLTTDLGAHEPRMAFLDVRESESGTYVAALKIPKLGRSVWPIETRLPVGCRDTRAPRRRDGPGHVIVERSFACRPGTEPPAVGVLGIEGGVVDVLVRFEDRDGVRSAQVVSGAFTEVSLRRQATGVGDRLWLGVEHILTGADHLLFVAGMMLLVRSARPLLLTITAFTIAHSLTLGLTALDIMRVPGPPVEAFIALSIVYLAYEIARGRRGGPVARPWRMAFVFGLLHGFGFAGALIQTGLPPGDVVLTLLLFNVGIEVGQVVFATGVAAGLWLAARVLATSRSWRRFELAAAYGLGIVATFWVLERVSNF